MKFTVHRLRGGRRRKWLRVARDAYLSREILLSHGASEPEPAAAIRLELPVAGGRATQVVVSIPSSGYGDLLLDLLQSDERAFYEALHVARRDLRERRTDEAEQAVEDALAEARAKLREERDGGRVEGH